MAGKNDDGDGNADSGTIFAPTDRMKFINAARNALSVASTSLFILERELSDAERTHKVSKHLTRMEEQFRILAKLIGVEGIPFPP